MLVTQQCHDLLSLIKADILSTSRSSLRIPISPKALTTRRRTIIEFVHFRRKDFSSICFAASAAADDGSEKMQIYSSSVNTLFLSLSLSLSLSRPVAARHHHLKQKVFLFKANSNFCTG